MNRFRGKRLIGSVGSQNRPNYAQLWNRITAEHVLFFGRFWRGPWNRTTAEMFDFLDDFGGAQLCRIINFPFVFVRFWRVLRDGNPHWWVFEKGRFCEGYANRITSAGLAGPRRLSAIQLVMRMIRSGLSIYLSIYLLICSSSP